jgi:hypothetical protein
MYIYTYHPDYTMRLPTTSPQGPVGPLLDWAGTEEIVMMADAQIRGCLSLAEEDHVSGSDTWRSSQVGEDKLKILILVTRKTNKH